MVQARPGARVRACSSLDAEIGAVAENRSSFIERLLFII